MATHPTEYKKEFIARNGDLELSHCFHCGFAHITSGNIKEVDFYSKDEFYKSHSPADWLEKEKAEYELWKPYFRLVKQFFTNDKPVIDIGCGAGWLIKYLHKRNYEVWGVEPSLTARTLAITEMPALENKFYANADLLPASLNGHIYLGLVLEHVDDPKSFLESCLQHLNGRLIIVVPNEMNLLQEMVGGSWFIQNVHRNYFTSDSLRNLLYDIGLKVIWEGATFPMELFILSGQDYRGNDEIGREMHQFRLQFEQRPGAFAMYKMLYNTFRIGRELIFVAEKK